MPDFSRSEYASYVQLCRELQLEHEWRDGDWCWCSTHQDPVGFICLNYDWQDPIDRTQMPDFWLPALADWLEMLEAAGYDYVRFWPRVNPRSWECEAQGINAPIVTTAYSGGSAFPTHEEAAARLYMAVIRTPADPAPPSVAR